MRQSSEGGGGFPDCMILIREQQSERYPWLSYVLDFLLKYVRQELFMLLWPVETLELIKKNTSSW